MFDFTIKTYKQLIIILTNQDWQFYPFCNFLHSLKNKVIILRHDVDKLPQNALRFAQIEHEMGIKGTYYFRIVPQSFDEKIIKKIAELGHEIGYHYEDLDLVVKRYKKQDTRNKLKVKSSPCEMRSNFASKIISQGKKSKVKSKNQQQATSTPVKYAPSSHFTGQAQYPVPSTQHPAPTVKYAPVSQFTWQASTQKEDLYDLAIESFQKNLEKFRELYPVKTICMHGSPMGRYDNRYLWKKYDYRDFGIIGEPYFDIDFAEVLYLTDTGRRWNGEKVSIWDKEINHKEHKPAYAKASAGKGDTEVAKESLSSKYSFKTTFDIIRAAEKGELPDRIMMTFHPQRWSDKPLPWIRELIMQNLKNVVKRTLISIRK